MEASDGQKNYNTFTMRKREHLGADYSATSLNDDIESPARPLFSPSSRAKTQKTRKYLDKEDEIYFVLSLNNLPNETLYNIFTYLHLSDLPSVALVIPPSID